MEEVQGKCLWDFFLLPEEGDRFRAFFELLRTDLLPRDYQCCWVTRRGDQRLIAWTSTLLPGSGAARRRPIVRCDPDIQQEDSTSSMSGVHPAHRTERVPVAIRKFWFAAGARSDSSEGWHRRFLPDGPFQPLQSSAEPARRAPA